MVAYKCNIAIADIFQAEQPAVPVHHLFATRQGTEKKVCRTKRSAGCRLDCKCFLLARSLEAARLLLWYFLQGMFETKIPLWDLGELNAQYDIDWEMGLDAAFRLNTPEECILSPKDGKLLLEGGPKLWEEWDAKCPDVINIAGNTGLLFCGGQHQFCGDTEAQTEAYKIYSYIKLSDSLMQYMPSRRPEFKGKGFDEMAVHSRRAGEGGYDWSLCINGNTRTCRNHVGGQHMDKFCDVRTMKGNCAIWLDLDYQIKTEKFLKSSERDYKFVLASDGAFGLTKCDVLMHTLHTCEFQHSTQAHTIGTSTSRVNSLLQTILIG